jgi:hypothetical protein
MSKEKTALGLNKWDGSEKPSMGEFNEDNRIIDEELRAVNAQLANKVTAGLLTKIALPLGSGVSSSTESFFYKNVFGEVTVSANLLKSDMANGMVLAILPIGYRPAITIETPATYYSPFDSGFIRVYSNGNIAVLKPISGQTQVAFQISFLVG